LESKLQFSCWSNKFQSWVSISINEDLMCLQSDDCIMIPRRCSDKLVYKEQSRLRMTNWIFAAYNSGYVLITTEDLIFIFGGEALPLRYERRYFDPFGSCDRIIAYDLNEKEFYECSIDCPLKGGIHAVSMRNPKQDEFLVFGFVNDSYRNEKFKNMIQFPTYLTRLMTKYFCTEYIHVLGKYDHQHFKINVDYLIESMRIKKSEISFEE